MTLIDYLLETLAGVEKQLVNDQERWGDTWKHRPREGQEERIHSDITNYFDQYTHAGKPIPWLKIIGLCHIALVRENHPEELIGETE